MIDYPNDHWLALDDEIRAERELMQLTKKEKGILAGLMETVFMPMDLISDQATLAELMDRGFIHQMELTNVVTITFQGIEAYQKSKG